MVNVFFTAATTAILLAGIVAAQEETTSHSTHDHGDESSHTTSSHDSHEGEHFEAAAVYDVGAGNNSLIAIPAESNFEEESLLAFMIVPAVSADGEGLEGAEEDAEAGESIDSTNH